MFGFSSINLEYVQLVTRHQRDIYGFIRSMVPDASTADDLLQETNIALLKSSGRFKKEAEFMPWATKTAYHKVIDHFRKEKRRNGLVFDSTLADKVAAQLGNAPAPDPARLDALACCLKKFPEADRSLISKRYDLGLTVRDIASTDQRSESTLQNHFSKLRAALRACIQQTLASEP